MIAFVRGHFAVKTPARIVVDVNGIGYELHISLNTYSAISNKDSGQLFTYLHITENAQSLFGFADLAEKESEEIAVIEKFLPVQMTEDEVKAAVEAIVKELGAAGPQDLGKVMGVASKQLAGKADGKLIAAVAKNALTT